MRHRKLSFGYAFLDRESMQIRHFMFFFLHDEINKANMIINVCHESYCQEYSNVLVNRICLLWSQLSSVLLNGFESWVDVKLLACYVDVDEWHVFGYSSKHINVLFLTDGQLLLSDSQRLAPITMQCSGIYC